jgi:hypothetical protein
MPKAARSYWNPAAIRRGTDTSITFDQGKENSERKRLAENAAIAVFWNIRFRLAGRLTLVEIPVNVSAKGLCGNNMTI